MSYSMGQYLYNSNKLNNDTYLTKIGVKIEGIDLYGTKYRDLKIIPSNNNFSFNYGSSYFLRLKIRRNTTYDLQVDLKLMNEQETLAVNQYQEIKRIYIPRADDSQEVSTVILYEIDEYISEDEKNVCSGILREEQSKCKIFDVYQEKDSRSNDYEKYFYKNENNDFIEIKNKRIIELAHTWIQKEEDTYRYFDIVFSPKTDSGNFNRIILELVRHSYDEDITFSINGNEYKGLHINEIPEENDYFIELYEVQNLLSSEILHLPITHLGVWSHPNLIMSINGEEIRVGSSGYYELNDFDITNLGIICLDENDKFTIDYQYEIT